MRTLAFVAMLALAAGLGSSSFAEDDPPLPAGLSGKEDSTASDETDDGPALPAGLSGGSESSGDDPALPAGLGGDAESSDAGPALPSGLGGGDSGDGPALPAGLGGDANADNAADQPKDESEPLFDLTGFWEARGGFRTQNDRHEDDASIGETRLHLELERRGNRGGIKLKTDFLYDTLANDRSIDLESGQGWIDLREFNAYFTPLPFMDVKIGRQVLTWGTGDQLFINDLFPKDWQSFFTGRDVEYLKAPSDALKVSLFHDVANLDIVYTPRFDADRFISGDRISYYSGGLGRIAGQDAIVRTDKPDDWFNDDEVAARLYRRLGSYEVALYGYHGFWKSPAGQNAAGKATFPPLSVYGASTRGPVYKGIGNIEVGYYDSEKDRSGDDPMVDNSQFRLLLGYEQDLPLAKDFTIGLQYYLEHMMQYADYRRTLPPGSIAKDENRHVLTLRLTKLLWQQNLKLSLFTFYSPSDRDAYIRPTANYKINDHWSVEGGGNIFTGARRTTFFGQFEDNSNVYAGMRYSF